MTFVKKTFVLSIITLIVGLIGYFIFWNHWTRYIFTHIGALGIIGLFACLTGLIAEKKGLNYRKAVLLGFFPSILLGIIADYLIDPPRENGLPSSCGGVVSLSVAIIIVIIYLMTKKRK
jgi:cell shape-determining protein MreD